MSSNVSKRALPPGEAGETMPRMWPRGRVSLLPALLAAAVLAASGCRGGMKTFSAPKWPGFGDAKSKTIEAPALVAAPSQSGPIEKPSAGATPYPTSSTPAGYVVADPATASGTAPGVVQTAATDPPAVTYGVTPAMPAPVTDPSPPAVPPLTPIERPTAIAPQVGPYASLPAPPPAADTAVAPGIPPGDASGAGTPGLDVSAAPSSSFPATAGYEPSRGAAAPPFAPLSQASAPPRASPTLVPVAPPASTDGDGIDARYASRGSSRFGNPSAVAEPQGLGASLPPSVSATAIPTAPVEPSPVATPLPAAPVAAPPPIAPPPASLPPQNPDGLTAPPVRRPDPVFRPGGTSSYRPAEQIFADDPTVAPSPVRTASFEVVDPPPMGGSGVVR